MHRFAEVEPCVAAVLRGDERSFLHHRVIGRAERRAARHVPMELDAERDDRRLVDLRLPQARFPSIVLLVPEAVEEAVAPDVVRRGVALGLVPEPVVLLRRQVGRPARSRVMAA